MNKQIKRIDIGEFRKLGFLQEVNRLFFHPLGLALEIIIDDKTGEEKLGGVWDYRDDDEGIIFSDGILSADKAKFVSDLFEKKSEFRKELFGFVIQPLPDEKDEIS